MLAGIGMSSCNQNSYSAERKAEKKLIANYMARNGYRLLDEEPSIDHAWPEKDYYAIAGYDNLYFHLEQPGDSAYIDGEDTILLAPVRQGDVVIVRYKQFTLTENPDTLSYWTTLDAPYPVEFDYLAASSICTGWHEAIRHMQYDGAICKIIVPSVQGFSSDMKTVTPYGYILKMKIKR